MKEKSDVEIEKKVSKSNVRKRLDSIDLVKKFPLKNKGRIVVKRDKWVVNNEYQAILKKEYKM